MEVEREAIRRLDHRPRRGDLGHDGYVVRTTCQAPIIIYFATRFHLVGESWHVASLPQSRWSCVGKYDRRDLDEHARFHSLDSGYRYSNIRWHARRDMVQTQTGKGTSPTLESVG